MFKYKNDICEYIRNFLRLHTYDDRSGKIDIAFKEYLNENKLILIDKSNLTIVDTLDDILKYSSNLECPLAFCINKTGMKCVICLLDQNLNDNSFKLIERKDNHV